MAHNSQFVKIEAKGSHYKDLNEKIQQAVNNGVREIILDNICGQRYIGAGLSGDVKLIINGVPGNDLAAFMDGPSIVVNSNTQDGTGNTMNAGKIIIHGDAGDLVGHSIRGGKIYIRGDAGYRVGIHMKAYKDLYPVIIIGGTARDFLGEYMAGGLIIVLGLNQQAISSQQLVGNYCGTGMHGGMMYIRGDVEEYKLGKEVKKSDRNVPADKIIKKYLEEYCAYFSLDSEKLLKDKFTKLFPSTSRPYGNLYAY